MVWGLEHFCLRPLLHDLAVFHYHNFIRNRLHGREIMGDEHVGQAKFVLQIRQKTKDAFGDQLIERRGHLVTDDELRLRSQRASNADALFLTT